MRGRKPKPTALKLLTGNPGKRRLNPAEPQPVACVPDCPEHLDAEARREWLRVSKQLHAAGLLTELERPALAVYCAAWSRWVEAEAAIRKYGTVLPGPKQRLMLSPWLKIANQSLDQMKRVLVEFGMTPASRSRVTPATTSGESELEAFLRPSR